MATRKREFSCVLNPFEGHLRAYSCMMPEIVTRQFGRLTYEESATVHFPSGLPGFERLRRFLLIENPPLAFLQSIESPSLCFLAAPVESIDSGYQLSLTTEDLRILDLENVPRIGKEVACLAILSPAENGSWTANLLAPVVIQAATRRAVQAVRMDARYSHRHPVGEVPLCS